MTWFEVQVETELAVLLQRVINAYNHSGKQRRAELIEAVDRAIKR